MNGDYENQGCNCSVLFCPITIIHIIIKDGANISDHFHFLNVLAITFGILNPLTMLMRLTLLYDVNNCVYNYIYTTDVVCGWVTKEIHHSIDG